MPDGAGGDGGVLGAVIPPGSAGDTANSDSKLRAARQAVQQARQQGLGIFDPQNPLRLEAFEVRFLSRASPPSRWVINLSRDDDVLIHPQNYHSVPRSEDRLFINREHVPLFVRAGWTQQAAPA